MKFSVETKLATVNTEFTPNELNQVLNLFDKKFSKLLGKEATKAVKAKMVEEVLNAFDLKA